MCVQYQDINTSVRNKSSEKKVNIIVLYVRTLQMAVFDNNMYIGNVMEKIHTSADNTSNIRGKCVCDVMQANEIIPFVVFTRIVVNPFFFNSSYKSYITLNS